MFNMRQSYDHKFVTSDDGYSFIIGNHWPKEELIKYRKYLAD